MMWIKLKGNLINLEGLTRIEKKGNKIIFYPLFEFEFSSESDADLIYNAIIAVIANKVHYLDLDKTLEKRQVKV